MKKSGRKATKKQKARSQIPDVPIASVSTPRVVGEPIVFHGFPGRSYIHSNADRRRNSPTPAERELFRILNQLNNGILRGKFKREYAISGKWIVDFFFPKIRLAIEVDGSIHRTEHQKKRDKSKDEDCAKFDITVLRITNREVYGNREALIAKLRAGWRQALNRNNRIIGMSEEEYFRKK